MNQGMISIGRPTWFDFGDRGFFAPPKTGWSTLNTRFPQARSGTRVPLEIPITCSLRDPVSRWISAYSDMVLCGNLRLHSRSRFRMIEYLGGDWFERWFPDPYSIENPLNFAAAWLDTALADLQRWGLEWHFNSQHQCYNSLLGQDYVQRSNLKFIDPTRWLPEIELQLGIRLRQVQNRGYYPVPKQDYQALHPVIQERYPEDCDLFERFVINTL